MKIKFDTDKDSTETAVSLVLMLAALYPDLGDMLPDFGSEEVVPDTGQVESEENFPPEPAETPDKQIPPNQDSSGIRWDERIHASSKALNADGTWRTKRGVDKALVDEVTAELSRAALTEHDEALGRYEETNNPMIAHGEVQEAKTETVVPPPAPPAPEAPTAPLEPAVTQSAPVDTVVTTPSAPVAPSSAVSPFVALMKRVTTAQGAGKLTQPRVKELLESLDKKSIMDLRTDEDALASFTVLLDGEGV